MFSKYGDGKHEVLVERVAAGIGRVIDAIDCGGNRRRLRRWLVAQHGLRFRRHGEAQVGAVVLVERVIKAEGVGGSA
jgi:hypothetical protein